MAQAGNFRLVLEDDRQAAWMAINDTFRKTPKVDNEEEANHGFLIQLGFAHRWPNRVKMDELGGLQVFDSAGAKVFEIVGGDLKNTSHIWWVNITQSADPMKIADLMKLRLLPSNEKKNRNLHKFMEPLFGGITVWPDIGMKIHMDAAKDPYHIKYTFELAGEATVAIYDRQNLVFGPMNVGSVVLLEVQDPPKGPPGQTENPPQYP